MILLPRLEPRQLASPLGRASPLVKLAVGFVWLLGLILTLDPRPALVFLAAAAAATMLLGRVAPGRFLQAWLPFSMAAFSVALVNIVFGAPNGNPAAAELLRLGPVRLTEPAVVAGVALGLRLLAIAGIGVCFAQTTEPTALADALVQQAHLPERFAYGALAAYQAVPRLSLDLVTLRQARRIRGLAATWHPRLLLALLVLAVRHADRMALAMDARGFDAATPRSRYRIVGWSLADAVVLAAGLAVFAAASLAARL